MGISGKCDFQDWVEGSSLSPEEFIKHYDIYAYDNDIIPLKFQEPKDLIPYYPYLVSMATGNKEGRGVIHLSKESFIDSEERESLEINMDIVKKYYRRCKRSKEQFDKEEALKQILWFSETPWSWQIEIVNRVEQDGEKADVDDIHDERHDYMRKQLLDLMIDAGWNEYVAYRWIYGWRRYYKKLKEKVRSTQ